MIGAAVLDDACAVLERVGCGDAAVAALRDHWPALRFVTCPDDDVPPRLKPAAEGEGWALYYIGGGEHCMSLTSDASVAIGLVLAEVHEEDG